MKCIPPEPWEAIIHDLLDKRDCYLCLRLPDLMPVAFICLRGKSQPLLVDSPLFSGPATGYKLILQRRHFIASANTLANICDKFVKRHERQDRAYKGKRANL